MSIGKYAFTNSRESQKKKERKIIRKREGAPGEQPGSFFGIDTPQQAVERFIAFVSYTANIRDTGNLGPLDALLSWSSETDDKERSTITDDKE